MYKTLSSPLTVQIELSSACPNNCVHCYNFWRNDDGHIHSTHLSLEKIDFILKELATLKVFDVIITGGEPLLNKKGLLFCLREASRLGLEFSMNTSLVPANYNYLKELSDAGLKNVLVSILGPTADTHDKIVQNIGAFKKTVDNIEFALKLGMNVVVNTVVTKINVNLLEPIAALVKNLGIKKFAATKAGCPGNCKDFSHLSLNLHEFRECLKNLYDIHQKTGLLIDSLEGYPLCGMKYLDIFESFLGRRCLAGVTTLTVASNGDLRPCSHLDIIYGNIFKEGLLSAWQKMDVWRTGKFLPSICLTCPLLKSCGGGCRMEAKSIFGKLEAMDPYASPKDVQYCLRMLGKNSKQLILESIEGRNSFILNKEVRWREESFGSVVVAGKTRIYLDKEGTNVLKRINKLRNFSVKDIEWGNLNSEKFLSTLFQKKVIL